MAKKNSATITLTQIKSPIGRKPGQKETLVGLGLNKMHKTVTLDATPSILGMVEKVKHMLKVHN